MFVKVKTEIVSKSSVLPNCQYLKVLLVYCMFTYLFMHTHANTHKHVHMGMYTYKYTFVCACILYYNWSYINLTTFCSVLQCTGLSTLFRHWPSTTVWLPEDTSVHGYCSVYLWQCVSSLVICILPLSQTDSQSIVPNWFLIHCPKLIPNPLFQTDSQFIFPTDSYSYVHRKEYIEKSKRA